MIELSDRINVLYGIGPKQTERLKKLGIGSLWDLINHFPRRYEDFSQIVNISQLILGAKQTVKGVVWQVRQRRSRKGLDLLQANIVDESGVVQATWFNQAYLKDILVEGSEIYLSGIAEKYRGNLTFTNPAYEVVKQEKKDGGHQPLHVARIIPIYPETDKVSSKWLRAKIKIALDLVLEQVPESLPHELLVSRHLIGIRQAYEKIHFPADQKDISDARLRFGFEELFVWQLRGLGRKRVWMQKGKAYVLPVATDELKKFRKNLPFELTAVQTKAVREILQDVKKDVPMNRLLEGDVGSGKTVVAAAGLLNTAINHHQAALMAPTEVLAEQHFTSLNKLLADFGLTIGLLTSSKAALSKSSSVDSIKKSIFYEMVQNGEIDIVIGTHALLQADLGFAKLAFVVIDEQHRFGVEQRGVLSQQSGNPDVLVMTATPIPRTLALALFGELEISIMDQMPAGRKPIKTRIVPQAKRKQAYDFVKQQLDLGQQAFVICPLVEESDKLEVKSATEEIERLAAGPFANYRLGLLHGRMKSREKEEQLAKFKNRQTDILVSTSVVEVGVDIPNATVMIIEGAERFGLAQLHQFRGRVGRSEMQSYCLLFTSSEQQESLERLQALVRSNDGFELAEEDLKLRGPGEVFGREQSGLPDLKMASLLDAQLLKKAREEAEVWIDRLEELPLIKERLQNLDKTNIALN